MRSFNWGFLTHRVFLLASMLFLCGCGGNQGANPPGSNQSVLDAPLALADTLKQLDALPTPQGVDPQQWQMLKRAFRHLLTREEQVLLPGSGQQPQ